MGSAISAVSGSISNLLGTTGSGSGLLGNIGGGIGSDLGSVAQGIASAIPNIPIADQSQLQNQINQNSANAANQNAQANQAIGNANTSLGAATNQVQGASNQAINQAQGAVYNAQQVNQGIGSNVNNAIGLTAQTAAGGGAAQQAANATLQQGTNQAIQSQQAIANSGNLSQMIGGQRTAMQNAATLQEQNALNAAQLQAGLATTAQGQYTGAAAQQASQAGTNAGLQQGQTAAQQNQASQLAGIGATQAGLGSSLTGAANTAQGNALTGQTNALGIQQGALAQSGENQALAVGGILNSAGTAAGLSDEDTKTGIVYASGPSAGQPYQDPTSSLSSSGSNTGNTINGMLDPTTYNQPTGPDVNSRESPYGPTPLINSSRPVFGQQTPNGSSPNQVQGQAPPSTKPKSAFNAFSGVGAQPISHFQAIPLSSDKHGKENIESQKDNKIKSFLDALDPVSFKYKQPDGQMGKTPGEHLGVIAQQVEQAPHGRSLILNTPQGKAIDSPSAIGALLAAASDINHRVSSLEEYFKSRSESRKDKK